MAGVDVSSLTPSKVRQLFSQVKLVQSAADDAVAGDLLPARLPARPPARPPADAQQA